MAQNFPPVNKIFDDLDKFRDYCRFEGKVFNEADLYKDGAYVWEQYKRFLNYQNSKRRAGANSKPFEKKPRRYNNNNS